MIKTRLFKKKSVTILLLLLSINAISQNSYVEELSEYCFPTWTGWAVDEPTEPITLVQLGQDGVNIIDQESSSVVSSEVPRYEDFSNISMDVIKGETYTLKVKGNTDGNNINYITVYFDWNGDGVFTNSTPADEQAQQQLNNQPEKHQHLQPLINSSGVDNEEVSHEVIIPLDAITGSIGMRIVKNYNAPSNHPCNNPFIFGQVEDYNLNIIESSSVDEVTVFTQNNIPAEITGENETLQLLATISPSSANQEVIWSIEEGEELASIDENGEITAIANGTIIVRATSVEDETKFDEISVLINNTIEEDYCEVSVDFDVEPITLVNFSDLNNSSSEIINGSDSYEDFTNMTATVRQGQTYTLTVKGNTAGSFEHDIRVFIDWNQDFNFDMQTEYYATTLMPSTGEDSVEASLEISIPQDAILGETRMRITKDMWNVYEEGEFNACTNAYYGQVEDYTLEVEEPSSITEVTVTTENNIPAIIVSENENLQLIATINPSSANQDVIWTIEEGNDLATVNENGVVTAIAGGTITVRATSVEDQTKYDEIEISVNLNLSIKETDFSTLKIYPNPTKNRITISAESEISEIQLFDVLGKQLLSEKGYSNSASLDLSGFAEGSYFLKINIDNQIKTSKIIKH